MNYCFFKLQNINYVIHIGFLFLFPTDWYLALISWLHDCLRLLKDVYMLRLLQTRRSSESCYCQPPALGNVVLHYMLCFQCTLKCFTFSLYCFPLSIPNVIVIWYRYYYHNSYQRHIILSTSTCPSQVSCICLMVRLCGVECSP